MLVQGVHRESAVVTTITLHGTGAGDPSSDRSSSGATVRFSDGSYLLIDAGEAIARSLLRDDVSPSKIRTIVVSHLHPDHWTGLPGLVTAWYCAHRTDPVSVFVPPGTVNFMRDVLSYSFWFPEMMPCAIDIEEIRELELADGMVLRSFPTTHLDRVAERALEHGVPVSACGFVLDTPAGRVVFSQDLGSISDLEKVVENARLLIVECAHVEPSAVLDLAQRRQVERVVFTHVPPEMPRFDALPDAPDWSVAVDGMVVELE